MATGKTKRESTAQGFDVESLPIAPGTKSRQRLPRNGEPDPLPTRAWWMIGVTAALALVLGILLGRVM